MARNIGKYVLLGGGALLIATNKSVRDFFGGGLQQIGQDVGIGGVKSPLQPAPGGQGATTAAGACAVLPFGDLASIAAAARKNGITNPTDPRSIVYGRTWWAINHNGDACSFNEASQADQIVWQSVAINGH